MEQHFCYAKVVACGRVIEREWGNPSKVPPSHSPFLAVGGSADNKTCGQSQKETPSVRMVFSFLEQHFCYAKVVACGRVIEREWGNPSKVPPSHSPFLAVGGSADNKTCGQSQKETPSVRMVFSFWSSTFATQKCSPAGG